MVKKAAPDGIRRQGPDAPIGAPSAWLSLVRLRPRRAGLRFTRQILSADMAVSRFRFPTTV